MALPKVWESTWEELAAQSEQFRGLKLRLTVLPDKKTYELDEAEQERLRAIAMRILEEADNTPREPGKPLTDPFDAEFGRIIEEKHRRIGLNIQSGSR